MAEELVGEEEISINESLPSYCSQTYSQASNTMDSFSCDAAKCKETYRRLQCMIRIKMFIAIITLIGGAFLALCINISILQNDSKYDSKNIERVFPGDFPENASEDEIINLDYCQYETKSENQSLCLDDWQKVEPLEKGQNLYQTKCHDSFKISQFFHYNKEIGTISKPKDSFDKHHMCLEGEHLVVTLNDCIINRKSQKWSYENSLNAHTLIVHQLTGFCLTGNEILKPVSLEDCANKSTQKWICLPVTRGIDKNWQKF